MRSKKEELIGTLFYWVAFEGPRFFGVYSGTYLLCTYQPWYPQLPGWTVFAIALVLYVMLMIGLQYYIAYLKAYTERTQPSARTPDQLPVEKVYKSAA
jgi:hypothetical protein